MDSCRECGSKRRLVWQPGKQYLGPRGAARRPGFYVCEPCLRAAAKAVEAYRQKTDAETKARVEAAAIAAGIDPQMITG